MRRVNFYQLSPSCLMSPAADTVSAPQRPGSGRWSYIKSVLQPLAILLVAAVLLALPAILNGFPLIFFDTSGYLGRSSAVTADRVYTPNADAAAVTAPGRADVVDPASPSPPGGHHRSYWSRISNNPLFMRPIFYSTFIVPFSTPWTFLILPLGQGFFAAYAVHRLFKAVGIVGQKPFILTILLLSALSSLPLHVSYVMPDVFTGIMIIMSFVASYSWSQRSTIGKIADVGIVSLLIAFHLSHILIAAALGAACLAGALLRRLDLRAVLKPTGVAAALVAPLVIAVALLVASNEIVARKPVISESSPLFLLARLLGDGPARVYLAQACPTAKYLLCSQLGRLGDGGATGSISDHFLWSADGAMAQVAQPGLVDEAARINKATIMRYPLWTAGNALRNGLRQLVQFQVDPDVNSPPPPFLVDSVARLNLGKLYLRSPQAHGRFPVRAASALIDLGLILSLALAAYVAVARRRDVDARVWQFAGFAVAGVLANAMATGALSEVHDRYGNRVVWLLVLAASMLACSAYQNRNRATASGEPAPRASL
jgi:hypothetical protein